jgi:O-antigen ligase
LPLAWVGLQLRSARGRLLLLLASVALAAAGWAWIGSGSARSGGLAARDAAGQLQASDDNRRVLYAATLQMIAERPVAGHGLGAWSTLWLQRNQREDMREFNTAHSVPLQLWAEGGAVGLLLLLTAVWGWAAAARGAGMSGAGAPLALVLLAWGLTSLVNAALRDAVFSAPMVVLTALGLALARPPQAGTRPPPH